jgi:GDP-mannose 6-dehydrogenase
MKIHIYGLGYVGCVSAACLANLGHDVTGIDVDEVKLSILNEGLSPIVEPGLQEAIQQALASKRLKASATHIDPADVSMICVGTPSNGNGSLRLDYVLKVTEQIGDYLRDIDAYHVVIVRSTVLPGTVSDTIIPLLEERSKKTAGRDFGVCMNPEFMREGTSIADFYRPIFTLIGGLDERSCSVVAEIYKDIQAPVIRTEIKVAEMTKYACNAFHALKVTFANEIGNICKSLSIDSHEVMDTFCMDRELNISPCYFKPGFAFGGSCLPKDMRALVYQVTQLDLESPLLRSILLSNSQQIDRAFDLIRKTGKMKVGILGLSFKPGTDDLRESPIVDLVEKLIGKGYKVGIYDKEVSLARIFGANKRYIEQAIPHIACLLNESAQMVVEDAELIVIGKKSPEFADMVASLDRDKIVVDLVRILPDTGKFNSHYEGICW